MMLQIVAFPTIVILTTLEVSFMLLENIYSTGITNDNRHLQSSDFYSTGYRCRSHKLFRCIIRENISLDQLEVQGGSHG
jgi:hypothetical protein